MKKETQQIKYVLYARKSSEAEDQQVASIDSQVQELEKLANEHSIKIVKRFTEAKSAKAPGRSEFAKMVEMIESGEANGIICWKLDRLARNPMDGGKICWLLQLGTIQNIKTFSRDYYPTDNVMMISVEFGMANQFIRDLSDNVKRGIRKKLAMGWCPGVAKPGYLNDKYADQGEKKIINDPKGFHLIQKMFRCIASGEYTPAEALSKLNNEWGYRSPKRKRSGGKPMSRTTFYNIIADSFYYGEFEFPKGSGNWHKGKHQVMISREEYELIQYKMGNRLKRGMGRPHYGKSSSKAFYGIFRCHDCNSAITPDEKIQTICSKCKTKFSSKHKTACPKCHTEINKMKNPTHLNYVYYGCADRKKKNCNQISIESKKLDEQIIKTLKGLKISESLKNWYIENINEANDIETIDRNHIKNNLEAQCKNCEKKLDNLLKLKISPQNTDGLILNDDVFSKQQKKIREELNNFKNQIEKQDKRAEEWMDLSVKTFNFACYAKYHFENGTYEDKKAILQGLGSNLLLKDGKLLISLPPHLEIIKNANNDFREINGKFEPRILRSDKTKTGVLTPACSSLHGMRESNPR
ncbi:recombinase family protein [bacterium]|nr:recombinase family protein [bacterium]